MNPLRNLKESDKTLEIYGLYSIKDELVGFAPPVIFKDDNQARRYFKLMMEQEAMMKSSPTDFSIWMIGQFNPNKGIIRSLHENEIAKIDWGVKKDE